MTTKQREARTFAYITGFCGIGCHEGTKLLSAKGALLKACPAQIQLGDREILCHCNCHEEMRRIREIMAQMGESVEETVTTISIATQAFPDVPGITSTPEEAAIVALGPINDTSTVAPPVRPPMMTGLIPLSLGKPSQEGERPRGRLEDIVFKVCEQYAALGVITDTSGADVGYIKRTIMEHDPEYNVSPGAIRAVLDRWVKNRKAECRPAPFRFVRFL